MDRVQKHFPPNTSFSHIVNELLFHFAETLDDNDFSLTKFYKEAAERAKADHEG